MHTITFDKCKPILRFFAGLLVLAIIVGIPYGWLHYRQRTFRNFRVVKDGLLYRSGQLTLDGLKRVIHDHGIRTVITLRDAERPGQAPPDLDEEEFCKAQELYHYRITPRAWEAADGSVPAQVGVNRFLEIMRDPKHHPVLIHCFAGIHRTGTYVAVYRMEFEHWPNARAIAELRAMGYVNLDREDDVRGFLERYQPGIAETVRPAAFQSK